MSEGATGSAGGSERCQRRTKKSKIQCGLLAGHVGSCSRKLDPKFVHDVPPEEESDGQTRIYGTKRKEAPSQVTVPNLKKLERHWKLRSGHGSTDGEASVWESLPLKNVVLPCREALVEQGKLIPTGRTRRIRGAGSVHYEIFIHHIYEGKKIAAEWEGDK